MSALDGSAPPKRVGETFTADSGCPSCEATFSYTWDIEKQEGFPAACPGCGTALAAPGWVAEKNPPIKQEGDQLTTDSGCPRCDTAFTYTWDMKTHRGAPDKCPACHQTLGPPRRVTNYEKSARTIKREGDQLTSDSGCPQCGAAFTYTWDIEKQEGFPATCPGCGTALAAPGWVAEKNPPIKQEGDQLTTESGCLHCDAAFTYTWDMKTHRGEPDNCPTCHRRLRPPRRVTNYEKSYKKSVPLSEEDEKKLIRNMWIGVGVSTLLLCLPFPFLLCYFCCSRKRRKSRSGWVTGALYASIAGSILALVLLILLATLVPHLIIASYLRAD